MNLVNATKLVAGYTMATDKTGREWLVVVAKGTYGIRDHPDREPPLLEEQVPLVMTDVFTGEPGFSAPLYEIDYAPRKPRCDVLLNGSAYAPGGEPTTRVTVSLRVGTMAKSFDVVGNRTWKSGAFFIVPTKPEPFTVMPISYDNAFGGIDRSQDNPAQHRWYPTNHAGVGFHEYLDAEFIDGKPLPNTEETGHPVSNPRGKYKPRAFGPIGRGWQPRPKLAGTYDQKWLDERFPFLPADFDERYYQAAPDDQQIDHPKGGEQVELINLTPEGRTEFKLPAMDVPVLFLLRNGERKVMTAVPDTVVLEPDQKRFMLTCRIALTLRRNIHEVREVHVGRRFMEGEMIPEKPGKRRYSSLAELAALKARSSKEEG
jgi:hypothetical protein